MKIAIIGYGKMGHMIEGIALERGHEICCRIDKDNLEEFDSEAFRGADVAIEFTTPATAAGNVSRCFEAQVPVVCGSTGWVNVVDPESGKTLLEVMKERCENGEGTLMWASNFSIGVNVFMAVNRYLARIMDSFPQYTPCMVETHHVHKLDHPSGTAITLAEQIVANTGRVSGWKETGDEGRALPSHATKKSAGAGASEIKETTAGAEASEIKETTAGAKASEISEAEATTGAGASEIREAGDGVLMEIGHVREGEVPGIHTIVWDSSVDDITITHSAKSRGGFALGAVMAAEWLAGKQGFHTIGEMLTEMTKQDIFK